MDFPLQGDAVAINKNRHSKTELQKHIPWYMWLTAHAFSHGFAVALITHNLFLGLMEVASHWIIDFFKCEKLFNIKADQALHILFKALYVCLLMGFFQ
jgi:hypothetical protein